MNTQSLANLNAPLRCLEFSHLRADSHRSEEWEIFALPRWGADGDTFAVTLHFKPLALGAPIPSGLSVSLKAQDGTSTAFKDLNKRGCVTFDELPLGLYRADALTWEFPSHSRADAPIAAADKPGSGRQTEPARSENTRMMQPGGFIQSGKAGTDSDFTRALAAANATVELALAASSESDEAPEERSSQEAFVEVCYEGTLAPGTKAKITPVVDPAAGLEPLEPDIQPFTPHPTKPDCYVAVGHFRGVSEEQIKVVHSEIMPPGK